MLLMNYLQNKCKNEFKKKIDIKNNVCYYFHYTMGINDISFRNILLDKKKYNNILIYDISCQTTFMSSIALGLMK